VQYAANLSLLYPHLPLLERPAAAAADGFAGAEILFPYDIDPGALRAALDDAGLAAVLINTPPGHGDERGLAAVAGAEERFRADLDRALDVATRLGAGAVHAMAGVVRPAGDDGPIPAEARRTLLANLRWAGPRAAERGVVLTLEGLNRHDFPGYCYATPAAVCAVLDELGDGPDGPVRLQFDLYHTAKEGLSVTAELEAALPWIHHVQIAGPPDRHEPTEADRDLFDAVGRLNRSGYHGWLGFEYRPRADTSAGLAWRRLLPA